MYIIATVVAKVCKYHNINSGSIAVGCDCVEALKKALDHNTSFSYRSNQFGIVTADYNIMMDRPIIWNWKHVKGHQYDHQIPLDRWTTMNVGMDTLVKQR